MAVNMEEKLTVECSGDNDSDSGSDGDSDSGRRCQSVSYAESERRGLRHRAAV